MNTNNKIQHYIISTIFFILVSFKCGNTNIADSQINTKNDFYEILMENNNMSAEIIYSYIKHPNIKDVQYPVLIYRYSDFMCSSCIFEDLSELELLLAKIGKDKILILPAGDDTRDNRIIYNNQLSKFNYFLLPNDSLVMPNDSNDMPQRYFALLDKNKKIRNIFFPKKDNVKLTQMYFSDIIKIFDSDIYSFK